MSLTKEDIYFRVPNNTDLYTIQNHIISCPRDLLGPSRLKLDSIIGGDLPKNLLIAASKQSSNSVALIRFIPDTLNSSVQINFELLRSYPYTEELATLVLRRLLEELFNTQNINRVETEIFCRLDALPAIVAAEDQAIYNCGFDSIGKRNEAAFWQGKYFGTELWELLRKDFNATQ